MADEGTHVKTDQQIKNERKRDLSMIKNKIQRNELYRKEKHEKNKEKRKQRAKRKREREENDDEVG